MNKKNNSVFVFGYQGLGNIGDDLMFKTLADTFKKDGVYIFSHKRQYAIAEEKMLGGFNLVIKMLFCEKFYVSGGNIFSYERPISILKVVLFYLLFYFRHSLGKETIIDSVGLNLRVGTLWRFLLILSFRKVSEASLRDKLSFRFIRRFSLKNVFFRNDRVFREGELIRSYKKNNKRDDSHFNGKYCTWFLSETAINKDNINAEIDLIKKIVLAGYNINFLVQEHTDELRLNGFLKSCLHLKKDCYKKTRYSYEQIDSILLEIECSDFSITERYHGALLSEVFSVKWLPFSQSEKLTRLDVVSYKLKELIL